MNTKDTTLGCNDRSREKNESMTCKPGDTSAGIFYSILLLFF